jgi:MFS family permease
VARWWFELGQGLAAIWGSRIVRALFLVIGVTAVGEGIMGSLFVVFAAHALAGGASSIGWLMSAQAVGGIVGGVLAAALASRIRPVPTVVAAFTLFGVIDTVIFNLPRFTPALAPQLALFALVGIPGAFGIAAAMTLLQAEIADVLRGRVFAAFGVVQAGAALVGASVAATLTDRLGVLVVLTVQGLGYVVAALLFGRLVRSARSARRPRRRVVLPVARPSASAGMAGLRRQFSG